MWRVGSLLDLSGSICLPPSQTSWVGEAFSPAQRRLLGELCSALRPMPQRRRMPVVPEKVPRLYVRRPHGSPSCLTTRSSRTISRSTWVMGPATRCACTTSTYGRRIQRRRHRFGYTFQSHIVWLTEAVFARLNLHDLTMVCHDWGGMLGLNLLASRPDRFRRVVASNFGLSEGGRDLGPGWSYLAQWLQFTQRTEPLEAG